MRLPATLIHVLVTSALVFTATGCALDSGLSTDRKAQLAKLPGPEVGTIDKTLLAQAQQATANGEYKRAAQMYKRLVDEHPDDKEFNIAFADNLRRSGDNESALKVLNKMLAKHPNDADGLEVKGLTLMNVGEFPEASKAFEKVMTIDGKRWRTLNALGIMFAIKKMDSQAVSYYNAALEASPDNAAVLNNLGLALAMDRQYDKCIDAFIRAKNHLESGSPELKKVDLNLALAYATFGKLEEAETAAAPHLSRSALYNNMGFYAYVAKNRELAKVYLNKALTQEPVYYERAWKNLAVVNGDMSSDNGSDNTQPKYNPKSKRLMMDRKTFDEEEAKLQEVKVQEIPASSGEPAQATKSPAENRKASVKPFSANDIKPQKAREKVPVPVAKAAEPAALPPAPYVPDPITPMPQNKLVETKDPVKSEGTSDLQFTAP